MEANGYSFIVARIPYWNEPDNTAIKDTSDKTKRTSKKNQTTLISRRLRTTKTLQSERDILTRLYLRFFRKTALLGANRHVLETTSNFSNIQRIIRIFLCFLCALGGVGSHHELGGGGEVTGGHVKRGWQSSWAGRGRGDRGSTGRSWRSSKDFNGRTTLLGIWQVHNQKCSVYDRFAIW